MVKGISKEFCDWVKARLVEYSEGVLAPELIFDERQTDLGMAIKQAVNSKLGCCVVLRAPRITQADGNSPDDTRYTINLDVAVLHNAALSPQVDSVLLSEELFARFAGAEFMLPSFMPRNVRADNLSHELQGTKWTHVFTTNYITIL